MGIGIQQIDGILAKEPASAGSLHMMKKNCARTTMLLKNNILTGASRENGIGELGNRAVYGKVYTQ